MKPILTAIVAIVLMTSGCSLLNRPAANASPATQPSTAAAANWVIFVVRHADRTTDGSEDPPLNERGEARAERLAERLGSRDGVAVYATAFTRTQQTAAPTAEAWGVKISSYDATEPAAQFAKKIRADHPRGAMLVVGHSDTVPDLVRELCRCPVPPMADDTFGDLYRVELAADGTVLKAAHTTY